MLRIALSASVLACGVAAPASAQLYFRDNFNRTTLSSPSPGPGGAYSATMPTGSSVTVTGTVLQLSNGTADNGNMFVASAIENSFPQLSALPRWIEWRFNFRISVNPSGFDGSENGIAYVLAATSGNFDAANGYAVVFERNGNNQIELVSFNNGLGADSNMTSIIATGNNPLGGGGTNYGSIRVTYNPVGNNWQLFVRNDGGTSFTDPYSGTINQVGATTSNNTFTSVDLTHTGAYLSFDSTNNRTGTFDNFTIAAVPEPTTWALMGMSALGLVTGCYRYRRGIRSSLETEVETEENEVA
ncbi:MAG TPA: PEP-CTERM sorting domain-containing protein [Gemmatales bacterium]|nr:PEP-CTERM sorting domain-containing protein [Gemmatales bacterium]